MPDTDIGQATNTSWTGSDYSVNTATTDAPNGTKEYRYQVENWNKWFGYYKNTPEVKISIDAKSTWTVGKGFKADELTTLTLLKITGNGKDTFNSILSNLIRTYHICGDAFAEIIRDKKGFLVNLKPIDPTSIVIYANAKGRIIRYEQVEKIANSKAVKKFKPEEILHLSRNRVADEIHGIGLIESVEETILMRNEAMADYKKLLHRNVAPVRLWMVDTDDATKIANFETKIATAKADFENIVIPKGTVETEIVATPNSSTLNPLPWLALLTDKFYQETGVPQVIVGGSRGLTEAATKIEYLAFEQTIENEQLYIEEQIHAQLQLEINLEFPASLQNELISDQGKSETMQASTPEDTSITNTQIKPGVAK